jgi:threonine/homoserine/homoserine lactone efflux protein
VAKPKEPLNPFYALVVALGVVLFITTFAYGVMAYRANAHTKDNPRFMTLLDEHGGVIFGGELALLGLATVGAMWLDGIRTRRLEKTKSNPPQRFEENGR